MIGHTTSSTVQEVPPVHTTRRRYNQNTVSTYVENLRPRHRTNRGLLYSVEAEWPRHCQKAEICMPRTNLFET